MMASHRTAWVQGVCWRLQLFNNYNMRTIMRWQKYTLGDGIMSWFLQGARECIWNCKGSAKSFLPETSIVANSARQMNPSPYCHIYAYVLNSGGEEFQKKTQKKWRTATTAHLFHLQNYWSCRVEYAPAVMGREWRERGLHPSAHSCWNMAPSLWDTDEGSALSKEG